MNAAGSAVAGTPARNELGLGERLRLPLMILGVAVVAIGALWFWLAGGRYMSTDDAYIRAAQSSISSNVAGRVTEILVRDNQHVRRGDLLFRLDPRPFEIAVAEAQAKLGLARLQIIAGKSTYRQQLAAQRSAQDALAYQQKEYQRQQRLLASGIASQAQFDQAQHARDAARQQLASSQQQLASVLAMLGGNPDLDPDRHPAVQQAQAELDRAELNLSYTSIHAADDGIVAQVEQLQVGDYINAANPVFALISSRDVWLEANFKEDQLAHMRPGQSATVRIDRYPGRTLKAHVASLSPGTGAQFSALPPENATGNWVKVVQRLPVRLELDGADADLPLQAGLSATVEVDTGHRRRLFGGSAAP
ncbi:MAG: HlyD family secretion protein [Nevskia sp.]|nr:HlyD family secretion protein [Nevskia sp.]